MVARTTAENETSTTRTPTALSLTLTLSRNGRAYDMCCKLFASLARDPSLAHTLTLELVSAAAAWAVVF